LLELTGNATSVAFLIIVQFLPTAVIGPVAGVVVDRVNRRRLMIVSALSSFVCGYALDAWKLSPFRLIRVLGALFVLPALGWLLIERRQSARYAS
jgi:MFS family permease